LHVSAVQAIPSSQVGGLPASQPLVGLQTSMPLQSNPSLQIASSVVRTQSSMASSQVSTVQPTPSLQSGGAPGWQPPTESQNSTPLQNAPSSQAASLGACWQLSVEALHVSVVQRIKSSQAGGGPGWQPLVGWQNSIPLQNVPSLQVVWFGL
jgi:hypothetical protein